MNQLLLQHLIEAVLDDEALTDGLTDYDANIIINWCIKEIEKLLETQSTESEMIKQAEMIKQKARLVCKIANVIAYLQSGEDKKIIKRLERLINNADDLNRYLALIYSDKTLAEKIQQLLSIHE